MTLDDIHSAVRKALARGNTLDESIPGTVKQAAMWIERNQTYTHMERFATKQPEFTDKRRLSLPSNLIKNIRFIRAVGQDGNYFYLNRIDPQDQWAEGIPGCPRSYWRENEKYLRLDAEAQDINLDLAWYSYTDWPVRPAETNWLIQNAADALVAQSMVFFAAELLSPALRNLYQPQRDEALRTLSLALEEEQYSDMDNVMRFS